MRRIAVIGSLTPLGRQVLDALRKHPRVELAMGVEPVEPRRRKAAPKVEIVPYRSDHRRLVEHLREHEIDTLVQCDMVPDRCGRQSERSGGDVIATMALGAAVGHADAPVRSWVLASSAAVHPIRSQTPLLHREDGELDTAENSLAGSILEAEDYARDVAERCPHLNVAILRLQELAGHDAQGPLAAVLAQPVIPRIIGFDPAVQLLHLEDAASALIFAADVELAGIYNAASAELIRWSEAVEGRSLPMLPIEAGPLAPLARRFGLPHIPAGMADVLRYGHAVDTEKLVRAGWMPRYEQRACLDAIRRRT
jgi:UDP-glucose 4-epimerase